jgi:predicted ATPase
VITGGPGSGKTTVLQELGRRGYPFISEAAREIIQEQVAAGGNALPWGDRVLYTELMLERSVQAFLRNCSTERVTFLDRGIPDTLCYARLVGLANDEAIREACAHYRYAPRVFIAPPWEEIYDTDSERKQDFAEAVRTYEEMLKVYRECGYELVGLPRKTPEERAAFILEQLE